MRHSRFDPTEDARNLAASLEFFLKDPNATAFPPLDSPFTEQLLANYPADHPQRPLAERFAREGYLQIDLGLPDFDARAARIIRDLEPLYPHDHRIPEAWYRHPDVRALACLPKVLELLAFLYQRRPIPFQTLNFDFGTEQATHSDMVHFYSIPRRFMCGVWIALEDVDEENGPLHYYPGSHRLPDFDLHDLGMAKGFEDYSRYERFISALVRANGLPRVEVRAKKGQAIVWAANLMHGGCPIRDPNRTRHSQVTHYFFEDCLWWQPAASDAMVGVPGLREVIDVTTGRFVTPRYHGIPLDLAQFDRVYRYPRPLPDWISPAES